MTEPVISYLRCRVVNRSPLFWFSDGFEQTGSGVTVNLWNSIGTDATGTLTRWNQVAGSWSIASNVITAPGTVGALMVGGTSDWQDMTFTCRFKFLTGAGPMIVIHCDGTDSNWIGARTNGTTLFIDKVVGGVFTNGIVSTTVNLTTGTQYWFKLQASGTTYTASIFNDSSGAIGALVGSSINTTISDAGVQSGKVGLRMTTTTSTTYGGAFSTVCTVTGTPPDGTQGQAWAPVVTTGEPAFAWSKLNPQAGTYSVSILTAVANDAGSWQQAIRLFAGTNGTLTAQAKTSAGTANVSIGALTTGNAGASFAQVSATGAVAANPTVSCALSGSAGTAYFDSLSYTDPAYEIGTDWVHLHQVHIDVVAFQAGNPGSSALGSWTWLLPPPGTEQYAASKALIDKLDYFHRVEFYISHDGRSLGKLYYAGIITSIRKNYGTNSLLEVSGVSDIGLANLSKPFPGEVFDTVNVTTTSLKQAQAFLGSNELGWADTFNPFTPANYTSTNVPTLTAGTWTGTTDDGFNVATSSTGTGAAFLAKTGMQANDKLHTVFVEVSGRLQPSSDATNAGKFGVGLSASNANLNSALGTILAFVTSKQNGSRYDLDVTFNLYNSGALTTTNTVTAALTSADDGQGFIPITISIWDSLAGTQVVVNGKAVFPVTGLANALPGVDPLLINNYPFLFFGTPATGSANGFFTNLVQQTRYSDDQNTGRALFKLGVSGSPLRLLPNGTDVSATFLEVWSRVATREGWYWRYTPQAYVLGTRTIGTVDLTTDPGRDRGTNQSVVFNRNSGNLVELQLSANADQFVSGTVAAGVPNSGGGGIAFWRDISSMTKYGVLDDQTLAVTVQNFTELRRAALNVSNNRVNLSSAGSKTAVVLRDAQTADVWRELDKVMIHDPELGINYLVARVIGYTFDEGQATQTLTLDQFSVDDPTLPIKRLQQGAFQTAAKFSAR